MGGGVMGFSQVFYSHGVFGLGSHEQSSHLHQPRHRRIQKFLAMVTGLGALGFQLVAEGH